MPRISNPYRAFYLSFASVWLLTALSNLTLGLFQDPLLLLDSLGVVFLVHDTHPEVTKGIDPEGDEDNFFKNDLGARLLMLLGIIVYMILISLMLNDGWEGDTSPTAAIRIVVDVFDAVPGSLLSLLIFFYLFSWIVGSYMYLREPYIGGILHRSLKGLLTRIYGETYDVTRLEMSLSGEEDSRIARSGRIFVSQMAVGCMLSVVVFSIAVLVYILLLVPVVTVVAILLWMAYEAVGGQITTPLKRLDKVTEAPQRLVFDFEVIEAGQKGVTTVIYIALTFFQSIVMLYLFAGLAPDTLQLIREWLSSGTPLSTKVLVSVIPFPAFLLTGVCFSFYSFIISYSLLNRLSVWLSGDESNRDQTVPSLPRGVSILYPIAAFVYFGLLFRIMPRISESSGDPETIIYLLAVVTVIALPLYLVLLYDAYKRARTEVRGSDSTAPEYDYYRIPLVLSAQVFGLWYLAPLGDTDLLFIVYVIATVNAVYFITRFLRLLERYVQSDLIGSILTDTYLFLVALSALLIANEFESLGLSMLGVAAISGMIGGLMYSTSLIQHFFFEG